MKLKAFLKPSTYILHVKQTVLKEQITIRLEKDVIEYFKALSAKTGITYQNVMNFYLRDCALAKLEPQIQWKKTGA